MGIMCSYRVFKLVHLVFNSSDPFMDMQSKTSNPHGG